MLTAVEVTWGMVFKHSPHIIKWGGLCIFAYWKGLLIFKYFMHMRFEGWLVKALVAPTPLLILILLTALQSQDEEQKEAAEMDGASALSTFIYLTLPHLARPITVVILIETIFLLTVFAEIFVTTGGGPGLETTNIAFLVYSQALIQFDVGSASAGGLVAVVIANIVAFFLVRIVGRNLEA